MAKFEYSIRSKDETGPGVKSATDNLRNLEGGVRGVSQTMKLLMGGAALGGITMALRRIAQACGEAEKAFAAMHPETQKAAGSLADWNNAMKNMQAATGGIVASILTPIRKALLDIIDPAHEAKLALQGVTGEIDEWSKKYTSSATKAAEDIVNANKVLAEAIATKAGLSGQRAEYQRMLSALGTRPTLVGKSQYYTGMGYDTGSAIDKAQQDIDAYDQQVKFLKDSIKTLTTDIDNAAKIISEIPKYLSEKNKGKPAGSAAGILDLSGLVKAEQDIATVLKEAGGNILPFTGGVTVGKPRNEEHDEDLIENAMQRALKAGAGRGGGGGGTSGSDKLMGILDTLSTKFASLSMILDPINTIMNAFWAAIKPVVDILLGPIVGALVIIGQTMAAIVAPILQAMAPNLKMLCDIFIFLYNMCLLPLANAFIFLFTALGALTKLLYYIVTFQWGKIKNIKWTPAAGSLLQPITTETLGSAGATATAENYGETSTYSAGRDITVNVVINSEVITGEGGFRELALMLNREIQNAMALGVA
jgi:hypothetical protein